jgi:hypothetical protein
VDDFGTGLSSLARLRDLPIDEVKIDRSFIADVDRDGARRRFVAGVLAFAEQVGLTVVAEGIEREAERDVLTELGCHRAQGFLFSRPVPAESVDQLLRSPRKLASRYPRPAGGTPDALKARGRLPPVTSGGARAGHVYWSTWPAVGLVRSAVTGVWVSPWRVRHSARLYWSSLSSSSTFSMVASALPCICLRNLTTATLMAVRLPSVTIFTTTACAISVTPRRSGGRSHVTVAPSFSSICASMVAWAGSPR